MNSKQDIENLLQKIEELYDATNDTKEKELYSKIALLELCGWLEITLDNIVLEYARPKLIEANNTKYLEKNIVNKINSFEYGKFREMLIQTIGIIDVEKLERFFDVSRLKSELGDGNEGLVKDRNTLAHTTVAGVMRQVNSPSITINKLHVLHPILENIENELNKI